MADGNKTYALAEEMNREDWQEFAPNESQAAMDPDLLQDEHLERILVDLHRLTDAGMSNALTFFANTSKLLLALNRLNLVDFMKRVRKMNFTNCFAVTPQRYSKISEPLFKGVPVVPHVFPLLPLEGNSL